MAKLTASEREFIATCEAYGAPSEEASAAFRALLIADTKALKAFADAHRPIVRPVPSAFEVMRATFGFMNNPAFAQYYEDKAS